MLQEALAAARQIADEDSRARALGALALQLGGESALLQEARAMARQIAGDEGYRTKVIAAISTATKAETSYDLWVNLAETLITLKRPSLLEIIPSLIPHIEQLGGQQAIRQTAQAIIDVNAWWP